MTDHGNMFGAYEFWSKATAAGVKPIIGIEAYVAPEHRRRPQPVRWGTPGAEGRRRLRRRRLHPHDAAGRDHRGHAQPVPAVVARLAGGLLLQAADGPGAARRARQGDHRHHRLPVRRGADPAAARPVPRGAGGGRRRSGTSSARGTSSSRSWTTAWPSSSGSGTACAASRKELDLPFVATNDSHYTVEADAKAHEVLLCVQTGSNMADPNRFKFDGAGYYLKTPAGDARRCSATRSGSPAATTPCSSPSGRTSRFQPRNLMPRFPCPDGETEETWLRKEVWRGMDRALPGRLRRPAPPAGRVRDRRHQPDGLPALLPGRRRLHQLGQAERHPGRPGPRLGRRVDGGLRAGHHRPGPDRSTG